MHICLILDELKINAPGYEGRGLLTASSNWGIMRGLETFSQLLFASDDFAAVSLEFRITEI